MIVVYPMLVSKTVSENIIPALTKTVEQYIITYGMDDVISHPERKRNVNFKIKGNKIIATEVRELPPDSEPGTKDQKDQETEKERREREREEREKEKFEREKEREEREKEKFEREKEREEREKEKEIERQRLAREKEKREKEKSELEKEKFKTQLKKDEEERKRRAEEEKREEEKKKAQKASAKVVATDARGIQLEPTYITVEVRKGDITRTEFIGVKVIPMRAKSDAKLADMLMTDYHMRTFRALLVAQGRKILKGMFGRLFSRWTRRLGGIGSVTGDPRNDVILAKTGFEGDTFVAVQRDDLDEDFFSSPAKIKKLFKLGWTNIIVLDDVNRIAYFCMKKFRGTCSQLSYYMMYQNLGQLKVYETLEDAKRQSSSLFKRRGPRLTKLVGECFCSNLLKKYSNFDEEI
jgi:hypothetical protein